MHFVARLKLTAMFTLTFVHPWRCPTQRSHSKVSSMKEKAPGYLINESKHCGRDGKNSIVNGSLEGRVLSMQVGYVLFLRGQEFVASIFDHFPQTNITCVVVINLTYVK